VAADHEIASRDHAKLNNAALLLQESYSKSYNDRKELQPSAPYDEEGSKKAAVLFIVNELFKIYFRLNTLRLCKNVAKPTEAKKLHELGTMGQMVTYKYFSGRLCLFEDNFVDAEQNLEYALSNCPNSAIHNKRCILRYLIPVKLYRGKLPTTTRKFRQTISLFRMLTFTLRNVRPNCFAP
jgi:nuclear mRNA export protein PCID2/THP1